MQHTKPSPTRRLVAVVTTAGLLVAGSGAMAGAAEPPNPSGSTTTAERPGRRVGAALRVAAEAIGIERAALVAELRGGKSVADVATAHDTTPQAVVDALVAAATPRVDRAVASGRIDADRAAAVKARLPERAAKLVNGDVDRHTRRRDAGAKLRRHSRRAGFAVVAKTIGIERAALRDAVRGGRSIADVARDHDVEPQAVVDAVVAAAGKRIERAVERGRLDADRAEQIKARVADRVEQRVNRTPGTPAGR